MIIKQDNNYLIDQVCELISMLKTEEYIKKLEIFNGSTIGQHIRHILEFYIAIENSETEQSICYDKRKRDLLYEVDIKAVIDKFQEVKKWIELCNLQDNFKVYNEASLLTDKSDNKFDSSIGRELLYAFDHTVHHLAIVRIGLQLNFPHIKTPKNLGVAPSTIKHKNEQCAQ